MSESGLSKQEQQSSLQDLMRQWKKDEVFDDWSEKQMRIFEADLKDNLKGALTEIKEGDKIIRAFPSILGRVTYFPAVVLKIDKEDNSILVEFPANVPTKGKHSLSTGIYKKNDPNWGWLAQYDDERLKLKNKKEPPLLKER